MSDRYEDKYADAYRENNWWQILLALVVVGAIGYQWFRTQDVLVPLTAGAGAILLVVGFKRPFVPCLLFVTFSFLRIHEAFPVLSPLRIPQSLALLSLAVLGWHVVLAGTVKAFWTRELAAFAVFFVFCTATIFTAVSRVDAAYFWIDTFAKIAIMVYAISWSARSPGDFHLASRVLVVAGIAVSAVAIYNRLNGIGLVEGTRVTIGREVGSLLGDPNDLALALLFPVSFAAAMVVSRTGWMDRILGFIGCVAIILAILATQSRGGLLGLASAFGVVGFRVVKNKTVLISVALLLVPLLFAVAGISGRSSGGAAEEGIDESSEGRIVAWHAAINMVRAHPALGVGMANFVGNYYFYTPEWDGKNHAVHSTWFGVLAETGLLGFGAFMTMVAFLALTGWRCLTQLAGPDAEPRLQMASLSLFAGFVSFCVSGTFLTQGLIWPIYILLALTVALSHTIHQTHLDEKGAGPAASDVSARFAQPGGWGGGSWPAGGTARKPAP